MYVQNAVKDSIKLSLKCYIYGGFRFLYYLSEDHLV